MSKVFIVNQRRIEDYKFLKSYQNMKSVYQYAISVIMSVHNENRFLNSSIKSILSQTFFNYEFIIIDDGSNIETKKILNYYRKKNKKIKIITNKKNLGLTKSLCRAIKFAKGKYIARIDADDISLKDRLKNQYEWLEKSSNRVMCGTNYFFLKNNSSLLKMSSDFGNNNIKRNMIFKNCFQHSSVMFKLSTYKKVGGYDINFKYSQDYALWSKIIHQGEVDNLKKRLIIKREHKNSISSKYLNEQTLFSIFISCNNFNFVKKKFFLNAKDSLKKNLAHLKSKKYLNSFYKALVFLNRRKLDKKYYLTFFKLNLKSLFYCIRQPKMLLYTLL